MDEQRAWIRSRRRKPLRIAAVILCICLLVTTCPDILETIIVFAAESGAEEESVFISDSVRMSEYEEMSDEDGTNPEFGDADEEGNNSEVGAADEEKTDPEAVDDNEEKNGENGAGSSEQESIKKSDGSEADNDTEDEEERDAEPEESEEEDIDAEENDVTVQENGEDTVVQALLERIKELPEPDGYMAGEPDIDNWEEDDDAYEKAYKEWMDGLSAYAEESLDIWEAYETLTGEQQEQIPEEALLKLTVWVEIAKQFDGSDKVMETDIASGNFDTSTLTWVIDDNGTLTISGNGPMSTTYNWGQNDAPYFKSGSQFYKDKIKSVVIEEGVTDIQNNAFYGLTYLTSVTIPGSVKSIGTRAFYDCRFTSITIPDGVESIEKEVFNHCTKLENVEIPDSVTSIGASAFRDCEKLVDVKIPDSVQSIGESAFYGCSSLTSVNIPNGVTEIGESTFQGCKALVDAPIPDTVTSIGMRAFYQCSSLTSVNIPNGVTEIKRDTFHDCKALTSVIIPQGVTSIGLYAFQGCSGMTSVTIPDSVNTISSAAFSSCSNLESVAIPDGVTSIETEVFNGCSSLTSVELPDNLTNIGYQAFNYCKSLTSVTIPDSVTSIESRAFSQSGLASVTIPDGVESIKSETFHQCTGLTSVVIPDSVTSIEEKAFYQSGLTSVTIPANVTSIGTNSFYCTSLSTATFKRETPPDNCYDAFYKYNSFKIDIPCGTRSAYAAAFKINDNSTRIIEHIYTFTANGAVITESCQKNCGHSATATLSLDSSVSLNYTGSVIKPAIVTYTDEWAGTNKKDVISYTNNKEIGQATAKLTISGAEATLNFTIEPKGAKPLTDDMIDIASGPYYFTGEPIEPDVTVKDGSSTLTPGTDYTVSYTSNTDAGNSAKITITGKGEYAGTVQSTFVINPKTLTADMITVASGPHYYTGNAITPAVTVEDGGKALTKDTDYTVSYASNTDAGTDAKVTVTGKGNYSGTITETFEIIKKTLTADMITVASGSHNYTGNAITPAVTVKDDGKALIKDTDYTLSYADNTNAGTASVTVTGKGKYTGTVEKTFTISPKNLSYDMLTLDSDMYQYTGSEIKPEVTIIDGGNTLAEGTDYTVEYIDNIDVGNGSVKIKGIGNYTGELNKSIWITAQDVLKDNQMTLTISGGVYGTLKEPAPKGSIAVSDTNPENIIYKYCVDDGREDWKDDADELPRTGEGYILPGKYLVMMYYEDDNCMGMKTASFTVDKKTLVVSKGNLEVENRNYNGTTNATLKEGGKPEITGVIEGDDVRLSGTLSARFNTAAPGKDIPVTITGFHLEGNDAEYYKLNAATLTLYATINNVDGTTPSSGNINSGGNDDNGNSSGNNGNGSDGNSGSSGNNGTSQGGSNNSVSPEGTPTAAALPAIISPVVIPPVVMLPTGTPQAAPGTKGGSGKDTGTQSASQSGGTLKQSTEPKDTETDKSGMGSSELAQADNKPQQENGQQSENGQLSENGQQSESETAQNVSEVIDAGEIVIDDGVISEDGNSADSGNTKCGLCHICPTFLGICCFIWLAIIAAVIIVVVIVILRRKKETEKS